jgi:hypothetical protein
VTRGRLSGVVIPPGESPEIRRCVITRNSGNGIQCERRSAPAITACEISGNDTTAPLIVASGLGHGGVCLFPAARAALANCLIAGNSGHGVSVASLGEAALVNCLIAGNSSHGVSVAYLGEVALDHCTVTGNAGAGVTPVDPLISPTAPALTGCIVFGNGGGSLVVRGEAGAQVSYSTTEGDLWPGEGNLNVDPLFRRPGVYDFARFEAGQPDIPDFIVDAGDYRLTPGSPAQDAVPPSGGPEGSDLAGLPRLACGRLDMGAFEVQECPERIFRRGDVNGDGRIDITDPVATLGYLFSGAAEPGCPKSADVNDDGSLNIADPIALLSYLFLGGEEPRPPFPGCGPDPTADGLPCGRPGACEGL